MSRTTITDRNRSSSRAALVAAALEEFSANGYEATTVAGIAERAGVTTGALYAHFDGKLDLLLETLGVPTVGNFWRRLAHASTLPWNEMVEELARGLARKPDRRTQLLLDIIVVARRDPAVASRIREGFDAYLGAMREATERGARSGRIDPAFEPSDVAQVLAAMGFGIMILDAIGNERPSPASLTTLVDLLLQFDGVAITAGATSNSGGDDETPEALSRVRARADAVARSNDRLHQAIGDAAKEGYSLRRIGEAARLSHEKVRGILGQRAAAAASSP